MTPDPWCHAEVHGDRHRHYCAGCRCTPARAARREHHARYRADVASGRPRTVDATGTRRRIQALMAAGWSGTLLADHLFVGREHIGKLAGRPRVTIRWAEAVKDLYDQIGLDEGPSTHSRTRALRAGWPPPIEWGADIDDPKAKPLLLDRVGRDTTPIDDIELLVDCGETFLGIERRIGVTPKGLERRLQRAHRRDLLDRLYAASEGQRWTA